MPAKPSVRFTPAQIAFHWLTAGLVLAMAVSGMMYFWEIADRAAMRAHQVMGQALIVVLALRLAVKARAALRERRPSDHAGWERALAALTHVALYAALIVAVVTGYVSASAFSSSMLIWPVDQGFARSDTGEQFLETHFAMKWVFLGLVSLHVAGALKHHFVDRDDTLRAMITPR